MAVEKTTSWIATITRGMGKHLKQEHLVLLKYPKICDNASCVITGVKIGRKIRNILGLESKQLCGSICANTSHRVVVAT